MKEQFIKFSKENNTGLIKLNRPKALNALDYDMATGEIYSQMDELTYGLVR